MSVNYSSKLDYYGNKGVSLCEPGELQTNFYGLSTCTAVWRMPAENWASAPKIGSPHPIWRYCKATQVNIRLEGPYAYATVTYSGAELPERLPPPVYEAVIGVSEDPIDTHPRFVQFAGTPMAPNNGARFRDANDNVTDGFTPAQTNKGYVFDSFATFLPDGTLNPKAKIQTYLNASRITYRKTWVSLDPPDYNHAGEIDNPPGNPPPLKPGAKWLNMGVTSRREGGVYVNTEEWMASGPRGWDSDIYR